MKKNFIPFIALIAFAETHGQDTDYNSAKGYIANGYDVVSYFNDDPAKGDEKFVFVYDNAKFKFKNQANLDAFKTDPEKYVPQYGGWCAYAIAKNGKKVSINPKTYEIRDGKLYLFYNKNFSNTLKSWLKENPEKLIPKADDNWEEVKYKKG